MEAEGEAGGSRVGGKEEGGALEKEALVQWLMTGVGVGPESLYSFTGEAWREPRKWQDGAGEICGLWRRECGAREGERGAVKTVPWWAVLQGVVVAGDTRTLQNSALQAGIHGEKAAGGPPMAWDTLPGSTVAVGCWGRRYG